MKAKAEEQMKFLKTKRLPKNIQENTKIWVLYKQAF